MNRDYILYKRQVVDKKEDTYGLEIQEKGSKSRVVAIAKSLDEIAQETFSNRKTRIRGSDRIVTLSFPILLFANRYIDKPVSSEEITSFFQIYERISRSP